MWHRCSTPVAFEATLNAAARVVCVTRTFDGGLSAVRHSKLHRLDIPERVVYKLGVMTYGCQHGKAPQYELLHASG